jgi:hypothetical protein
MGSAVKRIFLVGSIIAAALAGIVTVSRPPEAHPKQVVESPVHALPKAHRVMIADPPHP